MEMRTENERMSALTLCLALALLGNTYMVSFARGAVVPGPDELKGFPGMIISPTVTHILD